MSPWLGWAGLFDDEDGQQSAGDAPVAGVINTGIGGKC
jgi:hypothetical protein